MIKSTHLLRNYPIEFQKGLTRAIPHSTEYSNLKGAVGKGELDLNASSL